ncbi:hypothetical protein [Rubripirellula tenax]|nr:hypothetical protein [Rubripirellula tenax]
MIVPRFKIRVLLIAVAACALIFMALPSLMAVYHRSRLTPAISKWLSVERDASQKAEIDYRLERLVSLGVIERHEFIQIASFEDGLPEHDISQELMAHDCPPAVYWDFASSSDALQMIVVWCEPGDEVAWKRFVNGD